MKNSELWGQYRTYTKDVTEVSRKLGFAGTAICWVLKSPQSTFSDSVLSALMFFVAFFIADVLQSFLGAIVLRGWIHKEEIQKWNSDQDIGGEYLKPRWLDYPSFSLFIVKVALLLIGFIYLGLEIFSRTNPPVNVLQQ